MSSGNEDRAARFWTAALMGVDAPTPLMIDSIATNRSGSRYESVDYAGTHCSKSDDPNFWCSAFALLLGRYSNEDMVLFGVANDGAVRPVVAWMDWEQPFSKWSGKLESWQRTGSFKLRGALAAIPGPSQPRGSAGRRRHRTRAGAGRRRPGQIGRRACASAFRVGW